MIPCRVIVSSQYEAFVEERMEEIMKRRVDDFIVECIIRSLGDSGKWMGQSTKSDSLQKETSKRRKIVSRKNI